MLQNHKDRLLIGTTTNSILTAALSATALRNPLAGIELDKTALTMVYTHSRSYTTQSTHSVKG